MSDGFREANMISPTMRPEDGFVLSVEVVPPAGSDPQALLDRLASLAALPLSGFSIASNPVAKPRMCAMALCARIQQHTGRPGVLHCTTRDHNRLSLQSLLWGARGLGIDAALICTGDFIALGDRAATTTVRDVGVLDLISMAREAGFYTGVVFDPRPESDGWRQAAERLRQKAAAGAQFAVTQPVYDDAGVTRVLEVTRDAGVPLILGILPLRSARHAEFLHTRVAGIAVPDALRARMACAADPLQEGIANAQDMLREARRNFAGACLMPPFDHYEMLWDILAVPRAPVVRPR